MPRRPAGYRSIGNVYQFRHDLRTHGGIGFKAGEFAVCTSFWGGMTLKTRDGRSVNRVGEYWIRLIAEYDYTLLDSGNPWAHVGDLA